MLTMGRALMSRPKRLLMLDEPSLGLAPNLVKTIFGHHQKNKRTEDFHFAGGAKLFHGFVAGGLTAIVLENGRTDSFGPGPGFDQTSENQGVVSGKGDCLSQEGQEALPQSHSRPNLPVRINRTRELPGNQPAMDERSDLIRCLNSKSLIEKFYVSGFFRTRNFVCAKKRPSPG